jgi:CRP-like cAMP-binding protein
MRRVTQEEYPLETLHRAVNSVTFFKDLIHTDSAQFELLMSVSQFVTADPGEIIIHKGEDANILYFLLKGQLAVMADDDHDEVIGEINPGEMFGVMAMLLNFQRSASIKVSDKKVLLAGIDFQHFSDMEDFSLFSLSTKISFFRMLSNNLRWTLERRKMEMPDHPLIAKLRKIPIVMAEKNSQQELNGLYEQTKQLAALVKEWNESMVPESNDWLRF